MSYITFNKDHKNKKQNSFSNLLIPVQGPLSAAQDIRWTPTLGTMARSLPSQGHSHPPTLCSEWDKVDMPVHFTCTSLGFGRKPKFLEKTHAAVERMCKLHIVAPAGNS